jgi:hypothetical protein
MKTIAGLLLLIPFVTFSDGRAVIEMQGPGSKVCETAAFEPGAQIFINRDYTLKEVPPSLRGQLFLRTNINGVTVRCVKAGSITVLTPPEVPRATSCSAALVAQGFERVHEPESFQLFGSNTHEVVNLYRKSLKEGEMLRLGKWGVLVGFEQGASASAEVLYNGIVLPEEWPPYIDPKSDEPRPVPYLDAPPKVIPIDVGRQLFVDEFLIESTDLLHMYHSPEKYEGNPVLRCETALERQTGIIGGTGRPCIWWNPEKKLFYLWYQAGTYFKGTIALATSPDGLNWTRPSLDVNPGSNQVLPIGFQPDSYGIVADWEAQDPQQRFKLFSTQPVETKLPAFSFVSADGIHWTNQTPTGPAGDRSSMFYNPFRKKWVYSLRSAFHGRSRNYWECDDFLEGAKWTSSDTVPWLAADRLDAPEPGYKHKTQLYNFDAVAYESLMLGFFELHRGPKNARCKEMGLPKLNEISFGYSRDGFHYSRPDRRAHLPASRKDTWDRGFVESGGNICAVVGDNLYFYYSGCRGDMDGAILPDGSINQGSMYDPNAIGVAILRRDGFASLNAGASTGTVTTKPVLFSGSHLFVNADCPDGGLRAEAIDADGQVIEPFSQANCIPFSGDRTLAPLTWEGAGDLSPLAGKPVRFRFFLKRGAFYSFWVSADETGRSGGCIAGGGPGYTGQTDKVGTTALFSEKIPPE